VNPPYGRCIKFWLYKALREIENNSDVIVFLLPAYTDVKWFHEIVLISRNCIDIRFIKGRLKFSAHKNSAPFASMIIVFKKW
jgi:site-specific DNA-methyltransferase (adenine-specific)